MKWSKAWKRPCFDIKLGRTSHARWKLWKKKKTTNHSSSSRTYYACRIMQMADTDSNRQSENKKFSSHLFVLSTSSEPQHQHLPTQKIHFTLVCVWYHLSLKSWKFSFFWHSTTQIGLEKQFVSPAHLSNFHYGLLPSILLLSQSYPSFIHIFFSSRTFIQKGFRILRFIDIIRSNFSVSTVVFCWSNNRP